MSKGLKETLKDLGHWDGTSEFNFTKCLSTDDDRSRQEGGEKLLKSLTAKGEPLISLLKIPKINSYNLVIYLILS